MKRVFAVGSKTRTDEDRKFVTDSLPGFEVLGFINYHLSVAEADLKGRSVYESSPEAVAEAKAIKAKLDGIAEEVK